MFVLLYKAIGNYKYTKSEKNVQNKIRLYLEVEGEKYDLNALRCVNMRDTVEYFEPTD